LLRLVEAKAIEKGCQYIYLHVISYNEAARSFYASCEFEFVDEIPHFYHIQTGRAAYPDVDEYNACIYAKNLLEKKNHRKDLLPLAQLWQQVPLSILNFCTTPRRAVGKRTKFGDDVSHNYPGLSWLRWLFTGVDISRKDDK
jgi:hypothetical protein